MESVIRLHKVNQLDDSELIKIEDAGDGLDNYQISQEIGEGAYGKVYLAIDK